MASLINLCKICPAPNVNQVTTVRSFPMRVDNPEDLQRAYPLCHKCAKLYDDILKERDG